jgi:predicted GIY-YIG superfamily endonuclease
MKAAIRAAFEAVCNGFAADRVVADPDLNGLFIIECQNRGLDLPARDLNRSLLNLRKAGSLRRKGRSRPTSFSDEEDYRFASEIAIRYLERRDHLTLDEVICDPDSAREFDDLAAKVAPGYSPLQYRWAALNLRKLKALRPEILAHALPATSVKVTTVDQLIVEEVTAEQGLYVFFDSDQTLYVGEANNLRVRVRKHLDHSDNKGLARWLWEHGTVQIFIELHELVPTTETRIRRALEAELIRSRRPLFNTQRT